MAITRAQQFRQMLEDGGMLVQPSTTGRRPGYRRSKYDESGGGIKGGPSRPSSNFPTDDDQDADAIAMAQAMENQKFKGRRVVKDPVTGQIKTDLRTRPDKLADLKEQLRRFKATRNEVNIPGIGFGKGLQGIAQILSDFGAKFNRPYFEKVIAAERIPGLDLSTIVGMTDEEIEEAYKSYMADRLAGKTDAMGNLKAGFMRDALGNIISTGNDGREDPIIPAMAKAIEEKDTEEYVNPLSLLTPRIAGSRFLGSQFAADGGRIGYRMGGGPIKSFFEFLNKKNPVQAYTDYLKSIKDKTLKANKTGKFTDLPLAEVGIPAVGGAFINRAVKKRLQAENEKYERKQERDDKADGGMLVSPSKDGKRPGYRRSKYDSTGGGLASSSKASDISPGPGDDDSPQQTTTRKPTKPFGDDSAALKFTPRQLESFGIFGDPKKRLQLAADLRTESQKKLEELFNPDGTLKEGVIGSGSEVGTLPRFLAEDYEINKNILPGSSFSPLDAVNMTIDEYKKTYPELGTVDPVDLIQRFEKGIANPDMEKVSLPTDQLPRTLAAEGGIMDLGRQELFLGGIAKGLKKAARGVSRTLKKVAKSPIGKAALFAGLAGIPFGAGSAGTGFFGPKSLFGRAKPFLMDSLFGKVTDLGISGPNRAARVGGIVDFIKNNPMLAIAGTSALSGLLTKKGDDDDEDEFLRQYYNMRLDPSLSVRGTGSEFDFYKPQFVADGGRIGYQEGSKEPVAKKTMPLLDMDGQEMDLRDNGGFVPIGRMEKADDVPARLSKNEFVFTADAVRNAGDGDVDKGAEVMYNMMKNLERGGNVSDESQGLEGAREMFQTSKRLEEVL